MYISRMVAINELDFMTASILSDPIDCMERQRHGEAWMRKIETAHIFEAKTNEGYIASRDFVITHLKHWYWVTGWVWPFAHHNE